MGLRLKLALTYCVAVLLVLGAVYVYMQRAMYEFLAGQVGDTLSREVRLAAVLVERGLPPGGPAEGIADLADLVGRRLGVRVTVIDGSGVVIADSDVSPDDLGSLDNHAGRPEVVQARSGGVGRSVRHSDTLGTDMLYVARIAPGAGDGRTVVRLAMPVQNLGEIQGRVADVVRVSLGLGLLFAIALAYGMSRLTADPIRRMTALARSIASGDFRARVNVAPTSAAELRELGDSLNGMRREIQARITDITVSNSRWEAVLSSITEGMLVTEQDGRVVMTNKAFDRLFRPGVDAAGRMPVELIRNAEVQEAIERSLATSEANTQEMTLLGVPERVFDVHVAPIIQDGTCIGTVAVFYDISELRQLERVRKDFVANVSHELRTPLTAIKGCADTLAEGALSDREAAERFVRTIINHSNRLQSILSDLLDLSRLEAEELTVSRETCRLACIADSASLSVRQFAEEKSISVSVEIRDDLEVRCDGKLVEQAIINLLDNAIKYTAEEGRVCVTARDLGTAPIEAAAATQTVATSASTFKPMPSGQPLLDLGEASDGPRVRVAVEVTDTGIGIPSDSLPRLFERFYRVDRGRSRAMGGTGLGLSIVRHIVHAHGEEVYVTSELGKGSTFGFTLTSA